MSKIVRALPHSLRFALFAAVLCVLAPVGAVAQYGNFKTSPDLTDKDIAILRKLVREDLTGKPKGTTLSWRNPTSQNSGTVTLLDQFASQGRDCRRVRYLIRPGSSQPAAVKSATYVLTTCRMPDGSWKQDNQAKPDRSG
jgi:surface antigen